MARYIVSIINDLCYNFKLWKYSIWKNYRINKNCRKMKSRLDGFIIK